MVLNLLSMVSLFIKMAAYRINLESSLNNMSRYGFWLLLTLPGCWLVWLWYSGDSTAHYLLLPSGKYAIRMTVIALAVTPLRLLFPRAWWLAWLLKSRRAIGVSACAYGVLHTVFYLIDEGGFAGAMGDIRDPEIILGWLALAVFIVLGLSSNNWSMRKLGRRWKRLQRGAYLVLLLSFMHWFLLGHYQLSMLTHIAALIFLQSPRVYKAMANSRI